MTRAKPSFINRSVGIAAIAMLLGASAAADQSVNRIQSVNVVNITQWLPVTDEERNLNAPRIDPDAGAEALFWRVHVTTDIVGRDFEALLYHYIRIKIFNQRGCETQGTQNIEYWGRRAITDVAGRTIKTDGTILELGKDAIFQRDIVKAGGRKIKAVSFAMPGVEPGVIVEYRWRERRPGEVADRVRLPFSRNIPLHEVKYYILPFTIVGFHGIPPVKLVAFHTLLPPLVPERDGFTSVTLKNVPAYEDEPEMPSEWATRPWALLYYAEDKKIDPDKYWADLGKKLYAEREPYLKVSGEVRQAAEEAVAGAKDTEEKLARLVRYCRTRIKLLSDDTVTEQQREKAKENLTPADTLKHGIGPPVDILALFAAMARAEGFESRLAYLGDRSDMAFDRGFTDRYFLRWNAIAVKVGSQWRFYDPAWRQSPGGMLRWQEEGAPALICDPKEPVFVQAPISEPDRSVILRKGAFELGADGTLEGEVQVAYTGHEAARRREQARLESGVRQEDELRNAVRQQFDNAELSEVKVENVEDGDKPLAFSYRVKVPGYAQKTGKRMFLQMAYFERGLPAKFIATERKYPIMFEYPWTEEDEVAVKVPSGYALESPEAPGSFPMGDIGGYEASVKVGDGQLVYHRKLVFGRGGRLAYQRKVYPAVKQAFDAIHDQDQHTLTLRQQGAGTGAGQ
jgi:transglutaminase-like putative cysteine protease